MPKNNTASKSSNLPKDSPVPQNSTFLALPLELRMDIYQHFVDVPYDCDVQWSFYFDDFFDERKAILVARRSLWWVCRQVSQEWAPLFYRSTHVVVNGSKLLQFEDSAYLGSQRLHFTLPDFTSRFLNKLPEYSICSIRKLDYDVTLPRTNSTDFHNVERLPKVLRKYPGVLESLAELSIYTTAFPRPTVYNFRDLQQSQKTQRAWRIANNGTSCGKWDAVVEIYLDLLKGWHVCKSLYMTSLGSNEDNLKKLIVAFNKPESSDDLGTDVLSLHQCRF